MHELSIANSVIATVVAHADGRRVRSVRLRIGKLAGVEIEALRFGFDACAQDTPVEGAELVIEDVPGQAVCTGCDATLALDHVVALCPCDQRALLRVTAGEELQVLSFEV